MPGVGGCRYSGSPENKAQTPGNIFHPGETKLMMTLRFATRGKQNIYAQIFPFSLFHCYDSPFLEEFFLLFFFFKPECQDVM